MIQTSGVDDSRSILGFQKIQLFQDFTLPETNIFAPENGWLENYVPFGMAFFFQVLLLLVCGILVDLILTVTFDAFGIPAMMGLSKR